MSNDYPVTKRSNSDVKLLAKQTLAYFGVKPGLVDICSLVRRPEIKTVFGLKQLRYEVVPDHAMSGDDGQTVFQGDVVVIRVKRSVDIEASMGLGRARNTLAHELGHAVMHNGLPKSRRAEAVARVDWIKSFASAEHQVKVFAAALLINDLTAEKLESAEEISVTFGVSLHSAKIFFDERKQERDRKSGSSAVRKMADAFIAGQKPSIQEFLFCKNLVLIVGSASYFLLVQSICARIAILSRMRFRMGIA